MWMRLLTLMFACAVPLAVSAEDDGLPEVVYPALPETAATAEAFVPSGWRIEFRSSGDLNRDSRDDLLLVLRMNDPANIIENDGLGVQEFDTNPRMLVVAFADGAGYRRVLEDHTLIPRPDNPAMDDYLDGGDAVIVRRGAFTVRLYSWASAGSWYTSNTTFTFRHQDGCFRLIGFDSTSAHRGSGETTATSVNYATGKATLEYGNFTSDDPPEKRAVAVKRGTLPCLQEIGSGFDFEPGV